MLVISVHALLQFTTHEGPRELLLSTAAPGVSGLEVVEISPNDFFWGRGVDGSGQNHLGRLLMALRDALKDSLASEDRPALHTRHHHPVEQQHLQQSAQLAGR